MSTIGKDAKKVIRDYLDRKILGYMNRNDRCGAFFKAWGHVFTSHIRGDYVEFGVYKGDSLIESYKNYQEFASWLKTQLSSDEMWRREVAQNYMDHGPIFHGLDTFEGMPENNEENVIFSKGNFKASIEEVKNSCYEQGLKEPQLCLYKGIFKDTADELKKNLKQNISIANIDCDLYESTKDVLCIIKPYIQIGTVLLFDDYNSFSADNDRGQRKAFKEFCSESELNFEPWFSYQFVGQAFLCVGHKN